MRIIATCKKTDGSDWTVLSDATASLTASANVIFDDLCVQFAKVDGSGSSYGCVYKTVSERLDLGTFLPMDEIFWLVQIPNVTNVTSAIVRLGSSTTNYVEWRYPVASITAARWILCSARLGDGYVNGTGIDWNNVTHAAIGVFFDAENRTLAAIQVGPMWVDHVLQTG